METLLSKKKKLHDEKKNLLILLENLNKEITTNKYEIADCCLKVHGKHNWIVEREDGPYGERFQYCEHCGIDIHLDYFHF